MTDAHLLQVGVLAYHYLLLGAYTPEELAKRLDITPAVARTVLDVICVAGLARADATDVRNVIYTADRHYHPGTG